MSGKDTELLEQQRQRRKRINKLKSAIIMTISIWMIVSFLAICILTVQVVKLNSKFNNLEFNNDSNTGKPVTETQMNKDTQSKDTKEKDTELAKVQTGIDSEDNIAGEADEHKVYLTFDCELSDNTNAILDALKESNVKATFFVSGDNSEEAKVICKRIVDEGHTIGMHSYSNRYSTVYASEDAFKNDLSEISDFISQTTGKESIYYRFPGGSSNQISNVDMTEFVKILNQENITYFDWNVSAGDSSGDYTIDDIVSNVTTGVKKYKTSIVLLHDASDKSTTAAAIGPLIKALNKDKADILPIDENTYVVQYIKNDTVE